MTEQEVGLLSERSVVYILNCLLRLLLFQSLLSGGECGINETEEFRLT